MECEERMRWTKKVEGYVSHRPVWRGKRLMAKKKKDDADIHVESATDKSGPQKI